MNVFASLISSPVPPRQPRRPRSMFVFPVIANPWGLNPAQCEILRLMVEGETLKRIAHLLGYTFKTVQNYQQIARGEMGAKSGLHAALMWDRHFRNQGQQ